MNLIREFFSAVKIVFLLPFSLMKIGYQRFFALGARKIILLIFAGIVLTIVTAVIFVEATSQPTFCRSCHIMEPYFVSWETSSHKDVECITCHIPPGLKGTIEGKFVAVSMLVNYTTGVYKRSKPWAEIEDQNCVTSKCHESRELVGSIEWKKGIKFNHEHHLSHEVRNKQLRCTSCHGQIVQGAHITVTETTCFLCHFKNIEVLPTTELASKNNESVYRKAETVQCIQCHTAPVKVAGKPDPIFDHTEWIEKNVDCKQCHGSMKVGNGEVPHERCNICHASRDHLERINEIEFMHQKHVTERKVDCQNCHLNIQHVNLSQATTSITDCRSCHSDLHSASELLFRGTGGMEIAEQPDVMWKAGLHCGSCHNHPINQSHFVSRKPEVANCTPCHDANYRKLVAQWKNSFRIKEDQASAKLQTAKSMNVVSAENISSAEINIRLVREGGGWHNPKYANALLLKSEQLLNPSYKEATNTQQKPSGDLSSSKCMDCHTGIDAVRVVVNQRTFPHDAHLKKTLNCNDCHSISEHGVTLVKGKDCITCHHSTATNEETCRHCHSAQRAMYIGTANTGKPLPSVMAEAGVECSACHQTGKDIVRPSAQQCGDCHDGSYVEMGLGWQKQTLELLEQVRKISPSRLTMNARKNFLAVENDGSNGAHNPELSEKLLKEILNSKTN